jgi:hypothetical protein
VLRAYFPNALIRSARTSHVGAPAARRDPRALHSTTRARIAANDEAGTNVKIVLPAADEGARSDLRGLVERSLTSIVNRLGEPPPLGITVRFHPSVASYQRSTGRPWWTAATTAGTRVDLLPVSALRGRKQLETTLRHELTHVVSAASLHDAPLWVVEGLAARMTEPVGSLIEPGVESCPEDAAFQTAASAAELARLYERSSLCVAGRLSRGLGWRQLR